MARDSRLVYSTETGRIREATGPATAAPAGDGTVRIRRETKGRKGKGVTTVSGVPLDSGELKALASRLKQLCGTGGAIKDSVIEIQGDHRERLRDELQRLGYTVKLAGG